MKYQEIRKLSKQLSKKYNDVDFMSFSNGGIIEFKHLNVIYSFLIKDNIKCYLGCVFAEDSKLTFLFEQDIDSDIMIAMQDHIESVLSIESI